MARKPAPPKAVMVDAEPDAVALAAVAERLREADSEALDAEAEAEDSEAEEAAAESEEEAAASVAVLEAVRVTRVDQH